MADDEDQVLESWEDADTEVGSQQMWRPVLLVVAGLPLDHIRVIEDREILDFRFIHL